MVSSQLNYGGGLFGSQKNYEGGWSFSYFKGENPCGGLTKIGFERGIQL